MQQTSELLKEERLTQKLSISEVSMATKISHRMIKALEEGDLSQLPAKTFLRGFVQAYASYLKMDVDHVLQVFAEEMGSTTPELHIEPSEESEAHSTPGKSLPSLADTSNTAKFMVIGGIILMIGLVIGAKNLMEKYEREAQVAPIEEPLNSLPRETSPPEETAASPSESSETLRESTAAPTPPPTEAAPSPAPAATETAPTTLPTAPAPSTDAGTGSVVADSSAKQEAKKKTPEPETSTSTTSEPASTASEEKPATSRITSKEIILEALDRVEIVVKVNNEPLQKIVLQPDEVHTIKAKGAVTLDLSDGGAVNIVLNGQDRGVPGDLGKPKTLKLQ